MEIEKRTVRVGDLVEGFADNGEDGVVGFGGRLDIRPKYQRDFVYDDDKRNAVIDTLLKGFPLNVMYWAVNEGGGRGREDAYEVLDGQQRTISIAKFVTGSFSVVRNGSPTYFHGMPKDVRQAVLDYELDVYYCTGTEDDKLDWFHVVNIAGMVLTDQELRNAVYTGPWLTDAKAKFARTGCPAYRIAMQSDPLLSATLKCNRQDVLALAIEWAAGTKGDEAIRTHMNEHRLDANADEMWTHFKNVIDWVRLKFPKWRKEMRGLEWSRLYRDHSARALDAADLERKVAELMADEEVQRKSGIYEYVLTGNETLLNLRVFSDKEKREAYERQNGICAKCEDPFSFEDMRGDHVVPWSRRGKTVPENLQMLCAPCNGRKSDK